MSSLGDFQGTLFSLLRLLAPVPALWIAARFEPRISEAIKHWQQRPLSRAFRLTLWLAIGYLFTAPLLEAIGLAQDVAGALSRDNWGPGDGGFNTFWGTPPVGWFYVLTAAEVVAVFALVFALGWRYLRAPIADSLAVSTMHIIDRIFILLACGGLVTGMVRSVVIGVVLLQGPPAISPWSRGIIGFLGAWLLGLLLFSALVAWLNMRLPETRSEA
jgi:hypothetical protein